MIDAKDLRAWAVRQVSHTYTAKTEEDIYVLRVLELITEYEEVASALDGYGVTASPPVSLGHCAAVAVSSHQHMIEMYEAAKLEISDLRSAVISVVAMADSRRETLREIWAIRTTANETGLPFSLERAEAKLRAFRAEDVTVEEVQRLRQEIERLTSCLAKANAHHEDFERRWYLATDEIEKLTKDLKACSWPQPCTGCGVLVGDAQCGACAHGPTERRLKADLERAHAEIEKLRAPFAASSIVAEIEDRLSEATHDLTAAHAQRDAHWRDLLAARAGIEILRATLRDVLPWLQPFGVSTQPKGGYESELMPMYKRRGTVQREDVIAIVEVLITKEQST